MLKFDRLGVALGLGLLAAAVIASPAFAFGALAIQGNHGGNTGWSHNYSSKSAADEEALEECGPGCKVVLEFWNGCGAYAVDQTRGSTVYGWGTGSTRAAAENRANDECADNGGDDCTTKLWACE